MQITLNLPDNLPVNETAIRTEVAILLWRGFANALFQQKALLIEQAAEIINIDVDDFYQILVDRCILNPPADPDDDPDELILAHLRISLQQVKEGKFSPIETLWEGIDE
jgi:predicted HTH domain antitoxin